MSCAITARTRLLLNNAVHERAFEKCCLSLPPRRFAPRTLWCVAPQAPTPRVDRPTGQRQANPEGQRRARARTRARTSTRARARARTHTQRGQRKQRHRRAEQTSKPHQLIRTSTTHAVQRQAATRTPSPCGVSGRNIRRRDGPREGGPREGRAQSLANRRVCVTERDRERKRETETERKRERGGGEGEGGRDGWMEGGRDTHRERD